METFELILTLISAVLISSLLDRVIPRVSLPLIQIFLGFLIGLFIVKPAYINIHPDIFLLIFVAPLLFYDAKNADKGALWHNRKIILSLAIGLVIAIMLVVGFAVHALIPTIPLAAAFALGAALGPTDAVAVSSMTSTAKLGRKENALLSGESLINDASGVVSFQFAVAAAVTGTFSLVNASKDFAIAFFGGIVFGLVLGLLTHYFQRFANKYGFGNDTFFVLLDIALPFMIYLFSEIIGVSGILAVVAAGLLLSSYSDRIIGPSMSRLSIVSTSVWKVFTFALNGVVFVLLGQQLPKAMQTTWGDVTISNWSLAGYILAITAILVLVRFIWIEIMDRVLKDPDTHERRWRQKGHLRSTLVTTIGGSKGAVTLSILFSIPFVVEDGSAFPHRSLILFLASGVILCTLLLANFLLPVLAPAPPEPIDDKNAFAKERINILRRVIGRLVEEFPEPDDAAVAAVIASCNQRIERIQNQAEIESPSSLQLRVEVIQKQQEYILDLMDQSQIDDYEGFTVLRKLSATQSYLKHTSQRGWVMKNILKHAHTFARVSVRVINRTIKIVTGKTPAADTLQTQRRAEEFAVNYLKDMLDNGSEVYAPETVAEVFLLHQRQLRTHERLRPDVTLFTATTDRLSDIERFSYNVELDEIRNSLTKGDLTRADAKKLRDNVYLMLVDLETPAH